MSALARRLMMACASGSAVLTGEEMAKLQASDKAANDYFGQSVSISGDGTVALIGAYGEDTGGSNAGAAYVFVESGGTWTQQAKLQASDKEAGDYFGRSVSISGDGTVALIGAYGEDTGGSGAGAAYVFVESGGTWTQQAKLQASDKEADDQFGRSVSISGDGTVALIGASGEATGGPSAGAAYVFVESGGTWTQQAKLQASDKAANDFFGYSVSISGDGTVALIGAYGEDTGGSNAGAAYVFVESGGTWTQQAKLQASDKEADDQFGRSVSISGDGTVALIGAIGEATGGSTAGAAYVFVESGGTWTQQAKLQASDKAANDFFGYSVSISGDGTVALIGAYGEDTGGSNAGAAYVFVESGGTWTQQAKLQASDKEADDYFGYSVFISGDGTVALIGAYGEATGGSNAGAAYVFII